MNHSSAPTTHPYLKSTTLLLMAIACGLCAGGNYFNQPLLHSIAVALDISEASAAFTVTLAQVTYGCGLVLLVPLGDMLERRALAVGLMLLAAIGHLVSGLSSNFLMLSIGIGMAGLFSVAAQVLVPMGAALSDPKRSGQAVGLLMSGLLTGILLARSIAGLLSGLGGWTTVYWVSSIFMVAIALALWVALPPVRSSVQSNYGQILRSLGTLFIQLPRLRSRSLLGGLSFASLSVLFSTMALMLAAAPHHLNDIQIGLVGLAGVGGALMANVAGRFADKGWGQITTAVCVLLLIINWWPLWLGKDSLWWFIFGMLMIDLALAGIHITNQNVIYQLIPEARSRINAVYMTVYFVGAAIGSALATLAWQHGGWRSACLLGTGLALLTSFVFVYDKFLERNTTQISKTD